MLAAPKAPSCQTPAHRPSSRRCALTWPWGPARLLLLLVLLPGAFPESVAAQPDNQTAPLMLHVYKLGHQPAIDALPLVYSLLSPRGTLEIKPRENTLVLRDEQQAIDRVVALLDRFDHAGKPIRIAVQIIEARSLKFSPGTPSDIPGKLLERLTQLMPSHTFHQVATTELRTREGENVAYRMAERFHLEFQVGTVAEGDRLRLHGFRMARQTEGGEAHRLIHTTLNLRLAQTLYLGLAPSEDSQEALMLVLSAQQDTALPTGTRPRKER
jgi:hypothetical protein